MGKSTIRVLRSSIYPSEAFVVTLDDSDERSKITIEDLDTALVLPPMTPRVARLLARALDQLAAEGDRSDASADYIERHNLKREGI